MEARCPGLLVGQAGEDITAVCLFTCGVPTKRCRNRTLAKVAKDGAASAVAAKRSSSLAANSDRDGRHYGDAKCRPTSRPCRLEKRCRDAADALIEARSRPGVHRRVKWNSPV